MSSSDSFERDDSDFVVPSTPDQNSEEDTSRVDDFQTPFAKEVVQDSVQESFFEESPINPDYRQVVVDTDDSIQSESWSFENSESNNQEDNSQQSSRRDEIVQRSFHEGQTQEQHRASKAGRVKSNLSGTHDSEDPFQIARRHLRPVQNLLNTSDPNESYQVLQKKKHQNPIKGAQALVSFPHTKTTDVSNIPSPDDEGSFQPALRRNKPKARHNTIESSDEDSFSKASAVKTYSRQTRRIRTISSSDSEKDSSEDYSSGAQNNSGNQSLELKSSRSPNVSVNQEESFKETRVKSPEVLDISGTSIQEISSSNNSLSSPVPGIARDNDDSIQEIPSSPDTPVIIAKVPVQPSPSEVIRMRKDLEQKERMLKTCRLDSLPDGGARLKQSIKVLREKLSSSENALANSPARKPGSSAKELDEDELRKKIQMKKWALGTATGEHKDRLRAEINELERKLIPLTISNAMGSSQTYKPLELSKGVSQRNHSTLQLFPEMPSLSDVRSEIHRRMQAEQPSGAKLLSDPPPLSELQRQMFSDHPTKELYKKTEGGYISAAARREAVSVTLDALENMHQSLKNCPGENEKEPTPACLTVPLMPHQERALKWLLWRETQNPAGGILADDMGLGKTLTMISLIVRQKELDPPPPASSDVWLSKTVKIKRSAGTLIVCPASVVGQWENEIHRRCKRNTLSVVLFHGQDRNKLANKLHQYDVVITTYQIVSREIANVSVSKGGDSQPIGDFDAETQAKELRQSVLLQIAFNRIILDEAHVIRNPKSGVSQAVCRLRAVRRWAVTGTPVQNKELDMYSLLRFLRVSPFDQLPVWKRWVDSSKAKNEQAVGRLQLLIKTLLLRRTKDQKVEGSSAPLVAMPDKNIHTHQVKLSKEETEVYEKLLAFSRKALEDYLKSQENKIREDYMSKHGHVKGLKDPEQKNVTKQMVLVLLLRLRQVCSHPALIKTMLDTTDSDSMGAEEAKIEDDASDLDLISQMANMTIGAKGKEEDPKEEDNNFFTHTNPIFDQSNVSSKLKYVVDEVEKVTAAGDKAVIVSQWTSMLDVFAHHLKKLRIGYHVISGNVPLKTRTEIVEDFNNNTNGKPVILLSLNAGGVGLNLIGGNHLFLADMHWNPQLEAQACDRVFRVGQKKNVHIHRLVTTGTVEERILQLQQQKLALANGILTGAAKLATKGLTIEDLKMLFNPGPPAYGSSSFNSMSSSAFSTSKPS